MRSLLIYYSHSGNTASVVHDFAEILRKYSKVDVDRLKYRSGELTLLARILYRFTHRFIRLEKSIEDITDYDLLVVGIPVIGGRPAAAITKYLKECKNISSKKIICCYVYGFKMNAENCSEYVKQVLRKRGEAFIVDIFIPWNEVLDKEQTRQKILKALKKVGLSKNK